MLDRIKEFLADVFFFAVLPAAILTPMGAIAYTFTQMPHHEVKSWFSNVSEWFGL